MSQLDLLGGESEPRRPSAAPTQPLAEQLRPQTIDQILGQDHLIGTDGPIAKMLAGGQLSSLLLWGPPGTGKTTLARLLARAAGLHFMQISAVFSGVADLKKSFEEARRFAAAGKRTALFVDEIHRFNRAQQDGFLPVVEDGTVTLIGATTENPSFELNAALLSRMQVYVLRRLDDAALEALLARAESTRNKPLPVTPEARIHLRTMADGDGRFLLNCAETLWHQAPTAPLDAGELGLALQKRVPVYDKSQDGHYNLISALHKSLRGSDVDAALYYTARMLIAGEDPLYILRRVVRFASEDIGLADPQALVQALAAKDAYEFLGSPEGELSLVQAVIYCATAPKSNAAYKAEKAAKRAAKDTGSLSPPPHILNAPTQLMKDIGYGAGYAYDHDAEDGFSGQNYFPDDMPRQRFYAPSEKGFEPQIKKRLEHWAALRVERQSGA
ncbi:MAG: replication-associated recombination protein A [Pseudomonadota bacterium]